MPQRQRKCGHTAMAEQSWAGHRPAHSSAPPQLGSCVPGAGSSAAAHAALSPAAPESSCRLLLSPLGFEQTASARSRPCRAAGTAGTGNSARVWGRRGSCTDQGLRVGRALFPYLCFLSMQGEPLPRCPVLRLLPGPSPILCHGPARKTCLFSMFHPCSWGLRGSCCPLPSCSVPIGTRLSLCSQEGAER